MNNIEKNTIYENQLAAIRRSYWAVVFGLVPVRDGDQWSVLLGDDLQNGIAGFGDTPEAAIIAFEAEMQKPAAKAKR